MAFSRREVRTGFARRYVSSVAVDPTEVLEDHMDEMSLGLCKAGAAESAMEADSAKSVIAERIDAGDIIGEINPSRRKFRRLPLGIAHEIPTQNGERLAVNQAHGDAFGGLQGGVGTR